MAILFSLCDYHACIFQFGYLALKKKTMVQWFYKDVNLLATKVVLQFLLVMNEEELDEELKKLNVKEDFGEDSDLTPTNSPVPRIPLQNSCLPHSSNTSGFFDGDFTKWVLLKINIL